MFALPYCYSGCRRISRVSEVHIITNQGIFKRPICYRNELSVMDLSMLPISMPLASYEDFKQVAAIQQSNPSLVEIPIVLLNKKANEARDAHFVTHSTVKNKDKPFCLLSEMSLDYYKNHEKRFFVGHEMGHLQQHFFGNNAEKKAIREAIDTSNKNCGRSIGFMIVAGIFGGLYVGGHKLAKQKISKSDPCIPLCATATFGALGIYAYSRYRGYKVAQPLHQEEFACDEFAVQTGKTPQEKIAIAQGGITFLQKMDNVVLDLAVRTVLADKHPSNYARICRLRKMADQQKNLIEVQPSVTLSNAGMGLGFTVKIG